MTPFALYLHIPFCRSRCSYCDFNTYIYDAEAAKSYIEALLKEARQEAALLVGKGYQAQTLYVGGGTPSILPSRLLTQLLEEIQQIFPLPPQSEFTLEANPKTFNKTKLSLLKKLGVNRLSLGVQSFNDELLQVLQRAHSAQEARQAVFMAQEGGFDNLNLDFIFGLPGQSPALWEETLKAAVELTPLHLSIYGLTVEPETPLSQRLEKGEIKLPAPEEEAAMFHFAHDYLQSEGYQHYEISNYARPGYQSRHNWFYWEHRPYLGLGAGAYSYLEGRRRANARRPRDYIKLMKEQGWATNFEEEIDRTKALEEEVMLALRTQAGLDLKVFGKNFGLDPQKIWGGILQDLAAEGLIAKGNEKIILTPKGWWINDEITARLLTFLP